MANLHQRLISIDETNSSTWNIVQEEDFPEQYKYNMSRFPLYTALSLKIT